MARVMYTRFCRTIKRNKQTGLYSLLGSFATLELTTTPVSFVLVVYWAGVIETFQQCFAIADLDGNLLDQTPSTQCSLKEKQVNISTAFFYTVFPQAGHYNINIYQNGVCTEVIPLPVVEAQSTGESLPIPLARFRSTTQG